MAIAKGNTVEIVEPEPLPIAVEVLIEIVKTEPVVEEPVYDNETLFQICRCESDIYGTGEPSHFEKDGVTVLTGRVDSRDTGMCQINTFYHLKTSVQLGYDIFTPIGNWEYASYLLETQGTQPWAASRACWSNRL